MASIDPGTAIKVALALWDQRGRLESPLVNLRRRIKRRQMVIAIFGAGGVGKTTLGTFLSDSFDPTAGPVPYSESIGTEEFWLRSDRHRKVVVAPGQMRRIQYYWPQIYAELSRKKQVVIVNVVAYGYHSIGEEVTFIGQNDVSDYLKRSLGSWFHERVCSLALAVSL